MSDPAKDHSRVTPEGRALGFQTARLVEPAVAELVRQGEPDERCKSCAGIYGTVPALDASGKSPFQKTPEQALAESQPPATVQ